MHPLHVVRTVAVASVFGAFGALAACGGSSTPASNDAPDAATTNVDAAVDASGDDSSASGNDAGVADVGPDVPQQDPNTYPAMHHPLPQVDNAGGALLDHMKIVQVTFGTDAGVYPHGTNAKQFVTMVTWGMTPLQAIQAATVTAAEALNRSNDVGTIAVGHYGDLIGVAGDPLKDVAVLQSVAVVIKGGEVVKQTAAH